MKPSSKIINIISDTCVSNKEEYSSKMISYLDNFPHWHIMITSAKILAKHVASFVLIFKFGICGLVTWAETHPERLLIPNDII